MAPGVAHASPASEYAAKAVIATNQAREANGRKAFKVDECLLRFAKKQARRMAAAGDIFHQDLGPIMDECGLVTTGENVAYGYPTGRSVVNQGWMKSERPPRQHPQRRLQARRRRGPSRRERHLVRRAGVRPPLVRQAGPTDRSGRR